MKIVPEKLRFLLPAAAFAVIIVATLLLFDPDPGLMRGINTISECGENSLKYHILPGKVEMNWQIATLSGIFIGAILYSIFSGKFKLETTFSGNALDFGGIWRSALCGIAGGFLVMCAVMISGNSIWGHIGNAVQLSSGSWIFLASTLFAGMATLLLFAGNGDPGEKAGRKTNKRKTSTGSRK